MNRIIITLLLLVGLSSCDKDDNDLPPVQEPATAELLTSSVWLLEAYGYDDDSTGKIEPHENMINSRQEDNTTIYQTSGTGNVYENDQNCGGDPMTSFEWKLIDNDKAIEVAGVRMDIHKLTKTELHLIVQIPYLITPVHTIYSKKP